MRTNEAKPTNLKRNDFQYQPEWEFGLASNDVRIKSTKGHSIGTIEAKEIPRFMNMPDGEVPASFKPVRDWKNTFSKQLMSDLGLRP